MEIAPIPGIRVTPVVKPRPSAPELTAFVTVEAAVKPGDDTYTASGKKAAGAEENDEAEAEDKKEIAAEKSPDDTPAGRIDFFA